MAGLAGWSLNSPSFLKRSNSFILQGKKLPVSLVYLKILSGHLLCVYHGARAAHAISAPMVTPLALTIPMPNGGFFPQAPITLQPGTVSGYGGSVLSHLAGKARVTGSSHRRAFPPPMINESGRINTPASSPLSWDNPEMCSALSPGASQGYEAPVVHKGNLLLRMPCTGFFLFPVSLPHSLTDVSLK